MAHGRRVERVAALIRREMSQLLLNGIRDERVRHGMVTITDVEVSGDLQHCKVFLSVYGDESQKDIVLAGLNAAKGFVRGELGRKLNLRRAPEIVFKLDQGLAKGIEVLTLLERLEKERHSSEEPSTKNFEEK